MSKIYEIDLKLSMTSVFTEVLKKPLFEHFFGLFSTEDKCKRIRAYANMISEVYKSGGSLTDTVLKYIFEDENVYVKARARKRSRQDARKRPWSFLQE